LNSAHKQKLSYKLIMSSIAAFFVSTLLFLILQTVTYKIIHIYCKQPEVVSKHLQQKANALQQYIKDTSVSLSELSTLDAWMKKEDLTEVTVYHDNILLYSSHTAFPNLSLKSSSQDKESFWQSGYKLIFTDGEAVAFINDLFEHRYTDYATYMNLLAFFLCFITIMIVFIRKKVSYINTLEQEIKVLEGGDLHYPITIKGNDELACLAWEIDEMRKAFIAREQFADKISSASNELMTGISHDLRTPLTALIGYLEVMEGENIPAGQSPFLQKCKYRAFQIKDLIDDLFEYFFVTTSRDEQLQLRSYPVKEALDEIIKEYIFLMEQSGFAVRNNIKLPDAIMPAEQSIIQRIFDNLLSNIRRYADPAHPIQLETVTKPQTLILTIENHALNSHEVSQNTGLGSKACEKMMLLHKGKFLYGQQDNIYTVQLHFPIILEKK